MYESPITQILDDMKMHYEDGVLKAVQNVGFHVDKEELSKALQYDRGQYNKGYKDGYAKAIDEYAERLASETEWYSPGGYALPAVKIRIIASELKGDMPNG